MLKLRSWLSSVYLSPPPLSSKLYSNISALLLFFCFSGVIVYMFYNRLIRERLPRDLLEPVSSLQKSFYIYAIGINILILIILLWGKYQEYVDEAYEELGIPRKVNKLSLWYRFKDKLSKFSDDFYFNLAKIYLNIIYPRWQDEYHGFLIACFIRFNNLSPRIKLIYFYSILIIPKIIVVGVFLWDILIKNELNLVYKVIWLLLLPLIFKFIRYNYTIIHDYTIDYIREELNTDPHVFRGTDEDLDNIIANLSKKDLTQSSIRAHEFWEQEKAAWYKKIFYMLKEFLYDLQEKTGVERYSYNLRIYNILGELPRTIKNLDRIKKQINFPLNVILRTLYIICWSLIIKTC